MAGADPGLPLELTAATRPFAAPHGAEPRAGGGLLCGKGELTVSMYMIYE